jgi:hypothetical protein
MRTRTGARAAAAWSWGRLGAGLPAIAGRSLIVSSPYSNSERAVAATRSGEGT